MSHKSPSRCYSLFLVCLYWLIAPSAFSLDSDHAKANLHTGYRVDLCADLVKECLSSSNNEERTVCLHSSSQHLFCDGGRLGQIIYKRWAFSPDPGSESDEKLDPPDPVLIDQQCISSFDSKLAAQIIQGDFQNDKLDDLSNSLNRCIKEPTPSIFRP